MRIIEEVREEFMGSRGGGESKYGFTEFNLDGNVEVSRGDNKNDVLFRGVVEELKGERERVNLFEEGVVGQAVVSGGVDEKGGGEEGSEGGCGMEECECLWDNVE
ncbi:hypothetical protein Adt_05489 [Abeliophyllum distichum]|uniref:Uncharacterized protein n=1 Tax=Abeliophyllum distichum TaxID=126358 RepID=A0ABD1V4A7_9LAMI